MHQKAVSYTHLDVYKRQAYHVAGLMDFDVEIDVPGTFSVYNSLTAIAVCRHCLLYTSLSMSTEIRIMFRTNRKI